MVIDFEDVLKKTGGFGKWQKIQWFLLFLTTIPQAWYSYAPAFTAAKPKPHQTHCASPVGIDPCNYNCTKVEFDVRYTSIVTDWFLICDEASKIPWTKSMYYIGKLMGAYYFGWLSDRQGRWFVLMLTMAIQFIVSLVQSFSVNYWMFLFLRLPIGFCSGGTFIAAFTLATEMVRPKWRGIANGIIQSGYGVGIAVQALMSYAVTDWTEYNLVLTIPNILFISYWWFVPESPRWLLARGKRIECEKILRKIAATNKAEYPEGILDEVEKSLHAAEKTKTKTYHFYDLFRTKQLSKITIIEGYSWFVTCLVFYGLGFNSGNLSGNMYLNFALSGLVEIPAYILASYLVNRIGRRVPAIMYFTIGGVALLCILPIHLTGKSEEYGKVVIALALIGKFSISASFYQVYIHSAELFPTVVRGLGVGFSSMCSRVGGILTPLIVDNTGKVLPYIVFGVTALLAGILSFYLPETKGKPLPDYNEMTGKTAENKAENKAKNKAKNNPYHEENYIVSIHETGL